MIMCYLQKMSVSSIHFAGKKTSSITQEKWPLIATQQLQRQDWNLVYWSLGHPWREHYPKVESRWQLECTLPMHISW